MKLGFAELVGRLRLRRGAAAANYIELTPPTTLPSSILFTLPGELPGSTQALTCDSSGNLSFAAFGAGTVTSVGLSLPGIFSVSGSPVTGTGTLTGTLATQTANTIFAGPASGAAAAPTFRAIAWNDVSALGGTSSTSFALGNDSRFHTPNADTGTTSATFTLDSDGAAPIILKDNAGVLEVRNAADTAYANIMVGNVIVQGTATTINSETLTVADNVVTLNSNVTSGTPTENAGIEVSRGASTAASLLWDESSDRWMAGLLGSEIPLSRTYRQSFTNASLTAGVLTATHGLGSQIVQVQVTDNNNRVILPDETTLSSTTQCTIDLTSYGTLSGTWNLVVVG